jgi:hypothetical protein
MSKKLLAGLSLLLLSSCQNTNTTSRPVAEVDELPSAEECHIDLEDPEQGGQLASHYIYESTFSESDAGIEIMVDEDSILELASVPDAVIDENGEMWLYFVHGEREKHGIWVAKGTPGETLEVQSCILIDGEFNVRAVDPDIRIDENGQFVLTFYANFPFGPYTLKPDDPIHESEFYQAVSSDGIHFETRSQLFTRAQATDPTAIQLKDGSWLVAWPEHPSIHFMSSEDGLSWVKTETTLEFPPGAGIPELALLDNGELRLLIGGSEIHSYRSSDNGISWTKETVTRNVHSHSKENHPSLVETDEGWILLLNSSTQN